MPKTAEASAKKKVTKKAAPAKKEAAETKDKGLGKVKEATLAAMKKLGGKNLTHAQIAEVTEREKGNQLRELTALGLVDTVDEEGKRVHTFNLTAEGRKVAAKL